jgi:hypothetical protein
MTGNFKSSVARVLARVLPNHSLEAKLTEKNELLQKVREQVAKRDREISRLSKQLRAYEEAPTLPVFFIIGRGRSGTTWMRGILNSHPEILCWGEGRFFERSFDRDDYEGWKDKNITPTSLYGALRRAEHLMVWAERSVWARSRRADEHVDALTRLAVEYFMGGQLRGSGARIVGDKTPYVKAEVIEEIGAVLPKAKVIHIIRDGRDVAVSLAHHMWNNAASEGGVYALNPEELEKREAYRSGVLPADGIFTEERLSRLAADWSREVGEVVDKGPAVLGENYVEARYEDLLARPVEETGRLLGFLGADSSVGAAKRCVEKVSFERDAKRERGREDSTSRLRKGITGDWRNVFTDEDRRVFKEKAGDLLVKLGYESDYDW